MITEAELKKRIKGKNQGFLNLFHIFRLAGWAHWPFSDAFELFSAFLASVIFPFDAFWGYFHIYGTTDCAHIFLTSLACIGRK
jgi:hypothetical protein